MTGPKERGTTLADVAANIERDMRRGFAGDASSRIHIRIRLIDVHLTYMLSTGRKAPPPPDDEIRVLYDPEVRSKMAGAIEQLRTGDIGGIGLVLGFRAFVSYWACHGFDERTTPLPPETYLSLSCYDRRFEVPPFKSCPVFLDDTAEEDSVRAITMGGMLFTAAKRRVR